jgi:hypothetical protein
VKVAYSGLAEQGTPETFERKKMRGYQQERSIATTPRIIQEVKSYLCG